MKHVLLAFLSFLLVANVFGQNLEAYDNFDEYSSQFESEDKIYVINYWATWCGPCVKELPYFEQLNKAYADQNVEVVLVSIDFKNQRERRLQPFLEKHQLESRVIHLADPKTNIWIDKVDPSWSGAIPATVFLSGSNKKFMEKQFPTYQDLEKELNDFIKS